MTYNKWIWQGLSCKSKISCESSTISKLLSTNSIKTLWPACTATSFKYRQIGAYSISVTILGKLSCLNKKGKNPLVLF